MNALLAAGAALVSASLVLIVVALRRRDREPTGVAGNVASIERVYAAAVARGPDAPYDRLAASPVLRLTRALAARLTRDGTLEALRRRLDVAGNPGVWTPERVLSFKGLGLVAGALGGLVPGLGGGPATAVLFPLAGGAGGFLLPDVLLYNAGLRRQDEFRASLPDVLDLLVVSVEAGLGFDAALSRVARGVTGPLGEEFARLMQEIQIGTSREAALQAMARRTSVEELRGFVSALVQASEFGVPIGGVLREQAREMRLKRRQAAEEKAQKVPVKITFPVIMCILPALFIVVLGPGILSIVNGPLFHH